MQPVNMHNNGQTTTPERRVLFSVKNLRKYFPLKKKAFQRRQFYVHANENISLDIYEGETLGLVGESGSGKSTFGRTLIQIYDQTEGVTLYYGSTLAQVDPQYLRKDLKHLPKLYEEFKKESAAYDELQQKADALREKQGKDSDEYHALEESLMKKRRHIQNEYYNILRVGGGLLADDNLEEVSALLLERHQARVEVAKREQECAEIDAKLQRDDFKKDAEKLRARRTQLEQELIEKREACRQQEEKVEQRRGQNQGKEEFDYLESHLDEGVDLSRLTEKEMRDLRKDMQIIFQDPYSSLDTRMSVGNIIGEGIIAHGIFRSNRSKGYNEYVQKIMGECGLAPYFIHRYPHQFSGGQRQRIGIARALALEPRFIVCDEAVSALDVSIQSQVINLLQDLKRDKQLTYLFITHDLSVVKYISDRIAVMYLGMVVELSDSEKLFAKPLHPYTNALLAAIPRTDVDSNQELSILEGDVPSAVNPPEGCRFHTRCKYCMERCKSYEPEFREIEDHHYVACHLMSMADEERAQWMEECDQKERERLAALEAESLRVSAKLEKEN